MNTHYLQHELNAIPMRNQWIMCIQNNLCDVFLTQLVLVIKEIHYIPNDF